MKVIREEFFTILRPGCSADRCESLWNEVEKRYSGRGRHYHTLTHLDHLVKVLLPHKEKFTSWMAVIIAVAYHDAVYNVLKKNNEERSAAMAVKRMKEISLAPDVVQQVERFILATKSHHSVDAQTDLFTDADLSVLGAEPKVYELYAQQIRKEYFIYPDLMYYPGRKKVLEHFLHMPTMFKTSAFFDRYEAQARINLQWELLSLSK